MNKFEDIFVQHLPNSFYGVNENESMGHVITKARHLLLLAEEYLPSNVPEEDVKAILVPHAGLSYSGLSAAAAYSSVLGHGKYIKKIKNIVMLSTRHSGKAGILVPDIDYFKYNNVKFRVNQQLYTEFNTTSGIIMENSNEFLEEHSLEIQMPFIWNIFVDKKIKILPMLVGELTLKQVSKIADILNKLNTEETLWIINSDMMHVNGNYGYEIKENLTQEMIKRESQMAIHFVKPNKTSASQLLSDYKKKKPSICGIYTLILWTAIAKYMKIIGKIVSYYSCLHIKNKIIVKKKGYIGDMVNIDKMFHRFNDCDSGVVSYLSLVYVPQEKLKQYDLNHILTKYERVALKDYIERIIIHVNSDITPDINSKNVPDIETAWKTPPPFVSGSYLIKMGCFVSFKDIEYKLRGCIGTTSIQNDLLTNIIKYTYEAGFNDNRKGLSRDKPITMEELIKGIYLDINLLRMPKLITIKPKTNEEQLVKWNIGIDGIMMIDKYTNKTALFLSKVPIEMKWSKEETMAHLSNKAGLDADGWKQSSVDLYIIPGYCINYKIIVLLNN